MKNKDLIKKYADIEYPIVGDYQTKRYGNDRMNEYVQNSLANVIKLSNEMLCKFDKEQINTHFCFSDEGNEFELYKELHQDNDRMKNYFLHQNLKELDQLIEVFEEKNGSEIPAVYHYGNGLCKPTYIWWGNERDVKEVIKVNSEDRKAILEMLYEIREDFTKRLETWWKKYGAEHLHTWTYWVDR